MSFLLLGILNSQAAAGGAGAYDLLTTTELTSTASAIQFTGLDTYTDYKHLQIHYAARTNRSGYQNDALYAYFNSDFSSSNYNYHMLYATGAAVSGFGTNPAAMQIDTLPGGSETSSQWSTGIIDLLDFSHSSKNTTLKNVAGRAGGTVNRVFVVEGVWNNTNAVTSLWFQPFGGPFTIGTRFSIFGVK